VPPGAGANLLSRLFQVRNGSTITTSGIGGRVDPTSNDAGDQRQIGDPSPVASLLANADRGAALGAPEPSRTPELASGTASATATAPAAALRSSSWVAP
jgi:hypothetical protein